MDAGAAALVLVAAMCAVSIYGAIRIPHDARWPVRFGGFGYQTNLGRVTGLVMWPLLELAVATLVWWEVGAAAGLVLIGLLLMLWAARGGDEAGARLIDRETTLKAKGPGFPGPSLRLVVGD